jgi:hypothetical protein
VEDILGSNDGRKWVVASDADAHDDSPKDKKTSTADDRAGRRKGTAECRQNDDSKLDTIHSSSAKGIGHPPKDDHAYDDASTRRSLEGLADGAGKVAIVAAEAIRGLFVAAPVDEAQQRRDEVDGKDVVRIQEKADTSDGDGSNIYTIRLYQHLVLNTMRAAKATCVMPA